MNNNTVTIEQILKRDVCWDQIVIPGDDTHPPVTLGDNSELFWKCYDYSKENAKGETGWIYKQLTGSVEEIRILRSHLETLEEMRRMNGRQQQN